MEDKKDRVADALQKFRDSFDEAARKEIYTLFSGHLTEVSRMAAGYRTRYEKIEPDNDLFGDVKQLKTFNIRLTELLEKYAEENPSSNALQPFLELMDAETSKVPAFITLREDLKYYHFSPTLNFAVNLRAIPANTRYVSKRVQQNTLNLAARLQKKAPAKIRNQRRRHVPLRNIILFSMGTALVDELTKMLAAVLKDKSNFLQALWDYDFSFDERLQKYFLAKEAVEMSEVLEMEKMQRFIEDLQEKIATTRNELKPKIEEAFDRAYATIQKNQAVVDTPELPKNRFGAHLVSNKKNIAVQKFGESHNKWKNVHRTLFEDWGVDVEVVLLYYAVLQNYFELRERINDFFDSKLNLNFDALQEFLHATGQFISQQSDSVKSFVSTTEKAREQLNSEFVDKMLAAIIENLTGSFSDEIEKFNHKTILLVEKVSDRRGLNKSRSYDKAISESEISFISPRELLNFEALPGFEVSVQDVKKKVEHSLEKARIKLLTAGSVADFALESAILVFEQKRNAVKTAEKVALEGFERASDQINEAAALIATVRQEPLTDLQKAIHNFHADIQKLKNTQNLFDLNLRIARIRALERSRNLRNEMLNWVRKIFPEATNFLRKQAHNASDSYEALKDRIGFSTPQKRISYEISLFIKQTEQALNKLPFVYQRLYQLQPTNEDRFFVNRLEEYEQLKSAFDDWVNERYVNCAIIGEKGSGTTSFINLFLRKCSTELPVKRGIPDHKIHTKKEYLRFLAALLEVENFENNDDIIRYINNYESRLVIIIENLHHLFLKRVNGFDCQKMLFDLMVNTAKKAFWIGSYTIYSWEFLDKTIQISDHFLVELDLKKLSGSHLQEIIYKRNDLSGYKIYFEPPQELASQRSFGKLDTKAQQAQLERTFFDNLAAVSNGNVSLALLYWLRSTNAVTEDTIKIGVPAELDLSYVKDVKPNYLFAFYMMLVHDGLTLEDYAGIFNLPIATCRNTLVPMLEKGLLIRPKEKFNINPIIFRQVTNLLRSRNFIN
jgi:flagellar biosynthesis chaperone FliJ